MHDAWSPPEAPGGFDTELPLADLVSRLLAAIVDTVVRWMPMVPALAVAVAFELNGTMPDDPPPVFVAAGGMGVLGMVGVAAGQWTGIAIRGQSLGKWLTGIRIVRADGSPVDFVRGVILRSWVPGIVIGIGSQCCLGWALSLVDVLMVFGVDRRCLHDHIADTRVVTADGHGADGLTV